MGIRPSGLGLRLKSRQLQPVGVAGWGGARWPLVVVPSRVAVAVAVAAMMPSCSALCGVFDDVLGVMRGTARESMGERLLVRDLRSPEALALLSSSSLSSSTACCVGAFLRLRVMGPT